MPLAVPWGRGRNVLGGFDMARTTTPLPAQHLRALVLDDDDAAVRALRRSLEARCCSVVSAGDGLGGLALLIDELLSLDVLVLDLELPGRDARSFADVIRRAGGERDLSIVVLATAPSASIRTELLSLGVDAVVDRSAGPDAAADAVENAVGRRRSGALASAAAAARASPARDPRWTLALPWSPQPA
jgi:CheY-like chemotaxis protein